MPAESARESEHPADRPTPPRRTERGLDRLVNFSDATVAIAITLMILPLVESGAELAETTLPRFAAEHWGQALAFFISFAVIGRYWLVHHRVFEHVIDYDKGLAWLNLLWLACIAFFPFAQNALAVTGELQPDLIVFYVGVLVLLSLATLAIEFYLVRHPELLADGGGTAIAPTLVPLLLLIAAAVLSALVPLNGPWWLLLLFLGGPIEGVARRIRRR